MEQTVLHQINVAVRKDGLERIVEQVMQALVVVVCCKYIIPYDFFCEDINECDDPFSSNCTQICINSPGSFDCSCDPGHRLDEDGITCHGMRLCMANSSSYRTES